MVVCHNAKVIVIVIGNYFICARFSFCAFNDLDDSSINSRLPLKSSLWPWHCRHCCATGTQWTREAAFISNFTTILLQSPAVCCSSRSSVRGLTCCLATGSCKIIFIWIQPSQWKDAPKYHFPLWVFLFKLAIKDIDRRILSDLKMCIIVRELKDRQEKQLLLKMSMKCTVALTDVQNFFDRLFELDPELLALFSYNTNCGVAPECLSSPEFLDHVTKVSPKRIIFRTGSGGLSGGIATPVFSCLFNHRKM